MRHLTPPPPQNLFALVCTHSLRLTALALVVLLSACDAAPGETPYDGSFDETGQIRGVLSPASLSTSQTEATEAALLPGSIDHIFFALNQEYPEFAGAFEGEDGQITLRLDPDRSSGAGAEEIRGALLERLLLSDAARAGYQSRSVLVEEAAFSFIELATYKRIIEDNLWGETPLVLTDVDERENTVSLGFDEEGGVDETEMLDRITSLGIPAEAVRVSVMEAPVLLSGPSAPEPVWSYVSASYGSSSFTTTVNDYKRPLAGGLKIDRNGGCSLGIPVFYQTSSGSQTRGFLTASHCTYSVGYVDGNTFGQPLRSTNPIGVEHEDPPLQNCGTNSTNCELTDVAIIDLDNTHNSPSMTKTGHVYLTQSSSSTGVGSLVIDTDVGLGTRSPLMGGNANKVGKTSGWTEGTITGTCSTINVSVRHPDGVKRSTVLPCYIKTDTPVGVGDSGGPLFSLLYDPEPESGDFMGIVSACSGCDPNPANTVAMYSVSWAAINNALTNPITLYFSGGGGPGGL